METSPRLSRKSLFFGSPYEQTYFASDSEVVTLVVQQEPIEYYPRHSLPSNYWTRPIDAQLREWYSIAARTHAKQNPTKDILHIMEMLGHRDIKTTLIYTQLVTFESDEYNSATAKTTKEATQLVESGFEYICTTPENVMLFRKRK